MITAGVLGAGVGLGLTLLAYGLWPPRLSLAQTLAALHPGPAVPAPVPLGTTTVPGGWAARLGGFGVPLLARLGLPRTRTRADLVVCERDPARHLAEQATTAALGLVLPLLVVAALAVAGVNIGLLVPAWASLLLAASGFVLPD